MITKRLVMGATAIVATVMMLAGCSASPEATPTATGGDSSSEVQKIAQEKVAEYTSIPEYPGPTEEFDPGTGKTAVLACGFAVAICAEQANFAVDAVEAMGWESGPAIDGQLSPQVQGGFVDRAVQEGLDGIILVSVDVNGLRAAIDRAIAAEMPVMCIMCVSGPDYAGKGVSDVAVDFADQGEIAAWQILATSGGEAKVVEFHDPAFASGTLRGGALRALIEENCATCTVESEEFPGADVVKPGPPQISALLSTHPEGTITNLQPMYDGLAVPAAKTVAAAGRTDIAVGGYDGSPEALAAILSDDPPFLFTVSEPYTYASWAAVDLLGRTKAGLPLWEGADSLPSTLAVKENAQSLLDGNPAGSSFPAPDGDWQGEFKKFWLKD